MGLTPPIVLASEFVLLAQTIVSRQIDPQQPAVLTVGTIHGGTKNSIIPDEVKLGLTLRTYSHALQDEIVADIRRTLNGLAEANGLPADRLPIVAVSSGGSATMNDDGTADRLPKVAFATLGPDHVGQARATKFQESCIGSEPRIRESWRKVGNPAGHCPAPIRHSSLRHANKPFRRA